VNPTLDRLLALCRLNRAWVRAQGCWVEDGEGRRFLDFYSQYGAVALGHNAPVVVEAVRAALDACEPAMVQPYKAPHAQELVAALARLAPGELSCGVLTTSGAGAVEAAIKLVRARTGRPTILSAEGSFHGTTLGALAATGQPRLSQDFGPQPPGFEHVPFGDAAALERRFRANPQGIAALLLEPIQGEGGVHVPPPGYLAAARELCTQYGAALVLDEIQTGLGRTGRMFACEHEGVTPDVLLLAKALGGGLFPLGACLTSPAFWHEGFALHHSSTFANNNVACRVALAVLAALTGGGVCAEAARKGERLHARLAQIAARHPRIVAAVRGRGMLAAIELRAIAVGSGGFLSYLQYQGLYAYAVAAAMAEHGSVLVLPALGESNVLRIAPALSIDDAALEMGLDAIESVIARLELSATRLLVATLGAIDEVASAPRSALTPSDRIYFPPPKPSKRAPDYAFLVHFTQLDDIALNDPELSVLSRDELLRYCAFVADLPAGVVFRVPPIRSATGAVAEGCIIALPMLPAEMLRRGARYVRAEIARAVDLAGSLGARVVGLGGFTTPFSQRGAAVTGRGPAITTGNGLTAGIAYEATRELADVLGLRWKRARIAIVGARGSVGALCARLAARGGANQLRLVGNPTLRSNAGVGQLAAELEHEYGVTAVPSQLEQIGDCDVVFSATGAGRPILDRAPLASGAIVCDVARPPDASPALRAARSDLFVFDGGLVALPDPSARFGPANLQGLADGVQLGCLSETILLALAGESRDRGIGDEIPIAQVDQTMALARLHGFAPATPECVNPLLRRVSA
jgi:acetylornithine/succinyldiaminopimelate/putrescine aminotransferase/predicted amino acid dehydrogenase